MSEQAIQQRLQWINERINELEQMIWANDQEYGYYRRQQREGIRIRAAGNPQLQRLVLETKRKAERENPLLREEIRKLEKEQRELQQGIMHRQYSSTAMLKQVLRQRANQDVASTSKKASQKVNRETIDNRLSQLRREWINYVRNTILPRLMEEWNAVSPTGGGDGSHLHIMTGMQLGRYVGNIERLLNQLNPDEPLPADLDVEHDTYYYWQPIQERYGQEFVRSLREYRQQHNQLLKSMRQFYGFGIRARLGRFSRRAVSKGIGLGVRGIGSIPKLNAKLQKQNKSLLKNIGKFQKRTDDTGLSMFIPTKKATAVWEGARRGPKFIKRIFGFGELRYLRERVLLYVYRWFKQMNPDMNDQLAWDLARNAVKNMPKKTLEEIYRDNEETLYDQRQQRKRKDPPDGGAGGSGVKRALFFGKTIKRTARKTIKVVSITRSPQQGKKLQAKFEVGGRMKTIHFGAKGMSDFTKHKDKERRERYIKRHLKDLRTGDPTRAGYLSMYVLWNKPSLKASIVDYKKRVATYNRTGKFPKGIIGSKLLKK